MRNTHIALNIADTHSLVGHDRMLFLISTSLIDRSTKEETDKILSRNLPKDVILAMKQYTEEIVIS